jgi:type IV pilus assembly protein PilY1
MQTDPPTVLHIATLTDSTGKPQSITTRPELAIVGTNRAVYVGTGRYLGTDDLVDPTTLSLPWAYQQSFYAIKDKNADYGTIRSATPGLVQQTITALSTTSRSTSNNAVDWSVKDGWYVDFNPSNASPGERVNLDPQLVQGTIVVVTNVPNNNACTVGGDSWIYQFNYSSGTYVASAPSQQVAQKYTGQTTVGVVVVRLPSGVLKAIVTGATGSKSSVGVNTGGTSSAGRRVSWRELFN